MNQTSIYLKYITILFSFSALANREPSFLEKIEQVTPDLYKISAEELSLFLGRSFDPPPTITADELQNTMKLTPEVRVVNVLPSSLHNDCHISGSINIPLKKLVESVADWDRHEKIIVYCALYECDAGEKAYIILNCLGFTDVIDYAGGIKEWFQLGYSTQGPATYSFLHTKAGLMPEEDYPAIMVCSRQKKWIHKYQ